MVRQCLAFANTVVVGVANNSSKMPVLPLGQRVTLAEKTLSETGLDTRVCVEVIDGLVADFCKKRGIDVIVKGLRNANDFNYENPMSQMNRQIGAPPTVYVGCEPELMHISSSMVKEIARYGVDIYDMVNTDTAQALYDVFKVKPRQSRGMVIAARFDQNTKQKPGSKTKRGENEREKN